ncbi:glycoside hydrolase family 88 protein [Termitidicoccus mucosus]
MHTRTNTRALLARLSERTMTPASGRHSAIHADFNIDFSNWEWHQGVALHGLWQAGLALDDARHRRFIEEWLAARLAEGIPPKSINTTAPLLTIACLHELHPKAEYERLCRDYAAWCMTQAPRLPDGTFEHDAIYPRQVWADTLFMGALFLAKWGRMTGDGALLDQAARQFVSHYRYLGDPRTGLLFHGYDDTGKTPIGTLWGRGNGWHAIAVTEVLALLGDSHPARATILANLRRQFAGALATQDASGAWRTVMDEPGTYLEASCTAAFACAFLRATELGLAADAGLRAAAGRALERVFGWINENGELTHASAGTPVKPDAASYNAIPYATTPFAQGLALLALARALVFSPTAVSPAP